jgi:hypothetical protein
VLLICSHCELDRGVVARQTPKVLFVYETYLTSIVTKFKSSVQLCRFTGIFSVISVAPRALGVV